MGQIRRIFEQLINMSMAIDRTENGKIKVLVFIQCQRGSRIMKNIYLSIIKVVEKVGVMDLEQRRKIWESFNIMTQGDVSAQMKRFRLALECVKKCDI